MEFIYHNGFRWIIFQPNKNTAKFNIVDTTKPNSAQQELDISPTILGSPDAKVGALEIVEWANDNRHILIKHTIDNTPPIFIILDKDDLVKSINLNTLFNIQPSKVSLLGGKLDRVYIYLASGGILKIGDIKTKIITNQLYDQVLDFKQINEERLMYVTTKNSTSGKVVVNATNKENEFLIGETEFDPSGKYYLGAGEYSGDWYYVIGSSLSEKVHIYRNPQNFVASAVDNTPNILTTLRSGLPLYVSFSPGKRFIISQGDKIFTVYDVVEKKSYKTPINKPLDSGTTISWVDEYIMQYSQGGELYFIEFDGENVRKLISVQPPFKGYIDSSFSRLYTLRDNNGAVTSQLTTLTVGD